MREIFWDNGLSHLAQRWAEYCVFDHDCFNCRTLLNNQSVIVGQNAYALFGGKFNKLLLTLQNFLQQTIT